MLLLDLEILRLVWWVILGILLIGFMVFDGFDLGAATLLFFVGRTDIEREIVLHSIEPVWEGNQVWFILGAGAAFAAWPYVYAVSFSGFYFALFLVLFTIILRPVGFGFRNKMTHPTWRFLWDMALFLGGFGPTFILGVIFGNLFLGAPFYFDEDLRVFYTGDFKALFSPFALLCGGIAIAMVMFHGGAYLSLKTQDKIAHRARQAIFFSGVVLLITLALGGFALKNWIAGYQLVGPVLTRGASNPLHKEVIQQVGAWVEHYNVSPFTRIFPLGIYFFIIFTFICLFLKKAGLTFISSALSLAFIITTAGVSLFPFLLPSALKPNHSLTIWDASSSQQTLFIMLVATLIFLPCILAYTSWVYRVLRGKITEESLQEHY